MVLEIIPQILNQQYNCYQRGTLKSFKQPLSCLQIIKKYAPNNVPVPFCYKKQAMQLFCPLKALRRFSNFAVMHETNILIT